MLWPSEGVCCLLKADFAEIRIINLPSIVKLNLSVSTAKCESHVKSAEQRARSLDPDAWGNSLDGLQEGSKKGTVNVEQALRGVWLFRTMCFNVLSIGEASPIQINPEVMGGRPIDRIRIRCRSAVQIAGQIVCNSIVAQELNMGSIRHSIVQC